MTFISVLITAISIVFITYNEHKALYLETVRQSLDSLSLNTADELYEHMSTKPIDTIGISTKLVSFERYEYIKYAQVFDSQGELVQQYLSTRKYSKRIEAEIIKKQIRSISQLGSQIHGDDLMHYQLIGEPNYVKGYLLIVSDYRSPLKTSWQSLFDALLPLILLSIIVIMFTVHWFQNGIIEPLVKLRKAVRDVELTRNYEMDYKSKSNDEVSHLAAALKRMFGAIARHDKERSLRNEELLNQQKLLKRVANYDPLTKLPNRQLFFDVLSEKLSGLNKQSEELALLFIDLDDFKLVNDSLGHNVGDELLIQVGLRIKQCLRDDDVLSRIGGDEFVVILSDIADAHVAINITERILASFKNSFKISEWDINSNLSIGIAYSSDADHKIESLLSNADVAMYNAKASGRGTFALFMDEMKAQQHRQMLIANELSNALARNEFNLVYQPKVSNTEVVGLEALIRWQSPEYGLISPDEFIPIAEQAGQIGAITRWVLSQGFKDLAKLRQSHNIKVKTSFNLSAHDLSQVGLMSFIKGELVDNRLGAQDIEFEITESSYIKNFATANAFISELRHYGFSIALDDFGTGYSSLSYLTQVNADTLKIDKEFIRNLTSSPRDKMIVDTIIGLGKQLNMALCAEGVETLEEYRYLTKAGCHQIQGYFFSKPVSCHSLPKTIGKINGVFSNGEDLLDDAITNVHQLPSAKTSS